MIKFILNDRAINFTIPGNTSGVSVSSGFDYTLDFGFGSDVVVNGSSYILNFYLNDRPVNFKLNAENSANTFYRLLEDGFIRLLEDGSFRLLE